MMTHKLITFFIDLYYFIDLFIDLNYRFKITIH